MDFFYVDNIYTFSLTTLFFFFYFKIQYLFIFDCSIAAATKSECRSRCKTQKGCLGFQIDASCPCCLFTGPVVLTSKPSSTVEILNLKYGTVAYNYLGCFKNQYDRPAGNIATDSVEKCAEARDGQDFLALEYGGECWDNWGNRHTDGTLHQKLPDSDCESGGYGPGKDTTGKRMGGGHAAAVYQVGVVANVAEEIKLIHSPKDCMIDGQKDCNCCATRTATVTCSNGKLEWSNTACFIEGQGSGSFPLPTDASLSYQQRYKCMVEENFEIFDPSYSSGLLFSNSIYGGGKIGSYYGRGRLEDSTMRWAAAKSTQNVQEGYYRIATTRFGSTFDKKILGFAVQGSYTKKRRRLSHDAKVISSQAYVKTWKVWAKQNSKMGWIYREQCPSSEAEKVYEAHQTTADKNKIMKFLFPVDINNNNYVYFYPMTYSGWKSASLALLVEKGPPVPIPSQLPQFGIKFKGHINIQKKGIYTFKVVTSSPFQLAVNNIGIITQLQSGIAEGMIELDDPGFYPIVANYFYHGDFQSDQDAGLNRPTLALYIKFNGGNFRPLVQDEINKAGEPTNNPCPTAVANMRNQMRTTNTTVEMERTFNINEIFLPTVMQWSTSYQIYAMAHDQMPSSFGVSIGFGKERSCARKFCYATTVAGPDIKSIEDVITGLGVQN